MTAQLGANFVCGVMAGSTDPVLTELSLTSVSLHQLRDCLGVNCMYDANTLSSEVFHKFFDPVFGSSVRSWLSRLLAHIERHEDPDGRVETCR